MKYAIISDIHANLQALKAVLNDIKQKQVNKIICLGDIFGKGVNAKKCINLIRENCDIVLRGNIEDEYSKNAEIYKNDEKEYKRIVFHQSLIGKEELDYLKSLPLCEEFVLSGNRVRLFHAHPTSPYKTVGLYHKDISTKNEMFKPNKFTKTQEMADIVVYGHMHCQFMEKIYHRTIINCGSVGSPGCLVYNEDINGNPKESRQAHYLILEGKDDCENISNISICFQSVNYDVEKELQDNLNNPEKEAYYHELFNAKYRNIDKAMKKLQEEGFKI